ncbi:hypothetical protein D1872_309560 [compost metagenome]
MNISGIEVRALQRLVNALTGEPPVDVEIKLHRAGYVFHAQVLPLRLPDRNLIAVQIEHHGANASRPCI